MHVVDQLLPASPPCDRDHLCFFLLQTQQMSRVGFTLRAVVGSGSHASQTAWTVCVAVCKGVRCLQFDHMHHCIILTHVLTHAYPMTHINWQCTAPRPRLGVDAVGEVKRSDHQVPVICKRSRGAEEPYQHPGSPHRRSNKRHQVCECVILATRS
jgi:hypothetical protein